MPQSWKSELIIASMTRKKTEMLQGAAQHKLVLQKLSQKTKGSDENKNAD